LKEHHGLELRVAQAVIAMAHNPYREREQSRTHMQAQSLAGIW
jgi:hypothetical protein